MRTLLSYTSLLGVLLREDREQASTARTMIGCGSAHGDHASWVPSTHNHMHPGALFKD